jgi:hypothetical protein
MKHRLFQPPMADSAHESDCPTSFSLCRAKSTRILFPHRRRGVPIHLVVKLKTPTNHS